MNKVSRSMALVLMILFCMTNVVFASSLNSKKNSLNSSIRKTESNLKKTKNEKSSVVRQIQSLEKNLAKVSNELESLDNELEQEETKLERENRRLKEAEEMKVAHYDELKDRVKYMYKNSRATYVETLLQSKNINDFYNRSYYINKVMERDKQLLAQLKANKKAIEEAREEIEKSKISIELLKTEQENKIRTIENTKLQKGSMLVKLSSQEKKYMDQLAEL